MDPPVQSRNSNPATVSMLTPPSGFFDEPGRGGVINIRNRDGSRHRSPSHTIAVYRSYTLAAVVCQQGSMALATPVGSSPYVTEP
jgi:hypothetical protein